MDIQDRRRANLREWLKTHITPAAEKSYFSQLTGGHFSFGERAARRLETKYGMGQGYLDAERATDQDSAPHQHAEPHIFQTISTGDYLSLSDEAKRMIEGIIRVFIDAQQERADPRAVSQAAKQRTSRLEGEVGKRARGGSK